jgi:hypothetical protein
MVLVMAAMSCSFYVACGDDDVIFPAGGTGGQADGGGSGGTSAGTGGGGTGGTAAGTGGTGDEPDSGVDGGIDGGSNTSD